MFGKAIAAATIDDVERLIRDKTPEGRHLEYKEAVPVHPQQQKAQAKAGIAERRAVDMAVETGTGIADHGRNEILAELVAFANADGGVIVLGMSETNHAPPRAEAIHPIPHATKLERRLLDQIVDQIEPRLPYASVKTIPIGDDGAGVILIEAQPSILGPHRVKATRIVPI